MQQQTGEKANAIYNIQNKSNEIHNNDSNLIDYNKNHQIYEQKELEGTPFKLIKKLVNEKEKYFIAMGDHRLTDMVPTEKEALELLVTDYWKIVVNVIAVVTDITIKESLKYKNITDEKFEKILDGYRDGSYDAKEIKEQLENPYETESL